MDIWCPWLHESSQAYQIDKKGLKSTANNLPKQVKIIRYGSMLILSTILIVIVMVLKSALLPKH